MWSVRLPDFVLCGTIGYFWHIMAVYNPRNHLPEIDMWRAVTMVEQGATHRQAGTTLGVDHTVVTRAWRRYQQFGTPVSRHGGGRERATSAADDRFLVIQARRHRFSTASTLRSDLLNATGVNVSTQTIRTRLHEAGLRSRRPCIRIPLTRTHTQARLDWAMDHVGWTRQDWRPVLFTDESRFCLDYTDRRARVWRRPGERFHAANIAEHDRYGGGSVMVWGGISWDGRTDLLVLGRGMLTGERYRDEILDAHVRLYAGAIGENFVLMDDNARPHTANVVQQYLRAQGIERMDWPARSPDLNPIEHAWDELQRALQEHPNQPRTLQELGAILVDAWNAIPTRRIRTLIGSMNRRCQEVIDSRGSHTRY